MLRFNGSFIEVLPGFRVVPESLVYPLTDDRVDGFLEYFDDDGNLVGGGDDFGLEVLERDVEAVRGCGHGRAGNGGGRWRRG